MNKDKAETKSRDKTTVLKFDVLALHVQLLSCITGTWKMLTFHSEITRCCMYDWAQGMN